MFAGERPEAVEAAFWQRLALEGKPILWIVDDLPSGLTLKEIECSWLAQSAAASTLITTRSKEYGNAQDHIDLDVLPPEEAFRLLTLKRRPEPLEVDAAWAIIATLGYHPLALAVAQSFLSLGIQDYLSYLKDLHSDAHDVLELGATLKEPLPTGHERSISRTLLRSIEQLPPEELDLLQLASHLAAAPIYQRLLTSTFQRVDRLTPVVVNVVNCISQTGALSLSDAAVEDGIRVHTLVSRTIRFRYGGADRSSLIRAAAIDALDDLLRPNADCRPDFTLAKEAAHARHLAAQELVDRKVVHLAYQVSGYEYLQGNYSAARMFGERSYMALARLGDLDPKEHLEAAVGLAAIMDAEGGL